ncbi:MAG: hypothetical protein H7301_06555 [Cryobacterium sp.]|nr:hypothetical protein [Oligoflexia bacterium]
MAQNFILVVSLFFMANAGAAEIREISEVGYPIESAVRAPAAVPPNFICGEVPFIQLQKKLNETCDHRLSFSTFNVGPLTRFCCVSRN